MTDRARPAGNHDSRFESALAACLETLDSGGSITGHASQLHETEFSPEATEFIADLVEIDRLMAPLRGAIKAGATAFHSAAAYGASGLLPPDFGDYEILEMIGSGGMGVVYRARQKRLDRPVALKMIRHRLADASIERKRFEAESQAAACLDHPNIVPVHEVGEHNGQPYLAMKLIQGGSLADLLTSGDWDPRRADIPRRAAALAAALAHAVHHAHQRGILHRDLKPSNILLDVHGRPHVADFGLAKRLNAHDELTHTGELIGTPAYMAPEQVDADSGEVTTATDVYGLGAILYVLLTGQPPFHGASPLETLSQVKGTEVRELCKQNPAVDRDLQTICLKCLEKAPARRYRSAEALAVDLERWLEGRPIEARPVGRSERLWRWCRRNPLVAGLTTLAALLVAALLVGLSVGLVLLSRKEAETQRQRDIAGEQRDAAQNRELALRQLLYAMDMRLAYQEWQKAHVAEVRGLLDRHRPQADQEDLRGFEWYYLWRMCNGDYRLIRCEQGEIYYTCYSPDGALLATAGQNGTVKLWDAGTGVQQVVLSGHAGDVNWVSFSLDGRILASAGDDKTVRLWNLHKTAGRWQAVPGAVLAGHNAMVVSVVFLHDGKRLASCGRDHHIKLWDLDTGRPQSSVDAQKPGKDAEALAVSPDGDLLASAGGNSVRLWSMTRGRERTELRGHTDIVRTLAFSSDGKVIASGARDGIVRLWDAATGKCLRILQGHEYWVESVAFSPDDRVLVTGGNDRSVRVWEVNTGKLLNMLLGHDSRVWCVKFSSDGRAIASAGTDGCVRIWETGLVQGRKAIPMPAAPAAELAFVSEGKKLAVITSDARLWLWDLHGEPRELILPAPGHVDFAAISADGRMVAVGNRPGNIVWFSEISLEGPLAATKQFDMGGSVPRYSPCGKRAFLGNHRDRVLRIFDTDTWQGTDAIQISNFESRPVISPDSKTLAVDGLLDPGVELWDLSALPPRWMRSIPGSAFPLGFSSDGRFLATSANGTRLQIWDCLTEKELWARQDHTDWIGAAAFSPDGKTLASIGGNNTIRLWHVATGQEMMALVGHQTEVAHLAFSRDGRTLATAGQTGFGPGEGFLWLAASQADADVSD